jgi:hypothetical protein
MPLHTIVGHLVAITEQVTALLALVYAARPGARAGTRILLLVLSALNMALVIWAANVGGALLGQFERAAGSAGQEVPAATLDHAKGSDALSVASFVVFVVVLSVIWRLLAPGRAWTAGPVVAAVALAVSALFLVLFTVTTLLDAMRAVWGHHPLWPG